MNKSQAVADLTVQLSGVTTIERTQEIIQRALRATGLTNAIIVDESQMNELLQVIAGEGGVIQELAEQIAVEGLTSSGSSPSDQTAASASPVRAARSPQAGPCRGAGLLLFAAPARPTLQSKRGRSRRHPAGARASGTPRRLPDARLRV